MLNLTACSAVARKRLLPDTRRPVPHGQSTLVVCKRVCLSLGAFDLGEDLVGVLGPGERPRVVVPGIDEGADGGDELIDGGEGAATNGLAGAEAEEALHEVEP
jgi:hypothetical protein